MAQYMEVASGGVDEFSGFVPDMSTIVMSHDEVVEE
jgi:hypothetical protein